MTKMLSLIPFVFLIACDPSAYEPPRIPPPIDELATTCYDLVWQSWDKECKLNPQPSCFWFYADAKTKAWNAVTSIKDMWPRADQEDQLCMCISALSAGVRKQIVPPAFDAPIKGLCMDQLISKLKGTYCREESSSCTWAFVDSDNRPVRPQG